MGPGGEYAKVATRDLHHVGHPIGSTVKLFHPHHDT